MLCFYYQNTKPTKQTRTNLLCIKKPCWHCIPITLGTGTQEMVAGDEEFEAILSYKGNVRPAWATGDLVSKEVLEKKN